MFVTNGAPVACEKRVQPVDFLCRFEFNVDKINFGTVSFGFLNSRTGGTVTTFATSTFAP